MDSVGTKKNVKEDTSARNAKIWTHEKALKHASKDTQKAVKIICLAIADSKMNVPIIIKSKPQGQMKNKLKCSSAVVRQLRP